jgi:hypothetical protein
MAKSEFLEAIREVNQLDKTDEKRYLDACKEFAKFIKENNCKQIEEEEDE